MSTLAPLAAQAAAAWLLTYAIHSTILLAAALLLARALRSESLRSSAKPPPSETRVRSKPQVSALRSRLASESS